MTDSAGSVGGADSTSGANASSAAAAAAEAAERMNAVENVAEAMVDKATTNLGIDTTALGQQLAGLQAANPDLAKDLQAAVEAQLSPVDIGNLQAAMQTTTTPSLVDRINAPPTLGQWAGPTIDACGNKLASLSAPSQLAPGKMSFDQVMEHIDRITGGPISGLTYNGAYLAGADEKTLDAAYNASKMLDGFTEPLAQKATEPEFGAPAVPSPYSWR